MGQVSANTVSIKLGSSKRNVGGDETSVLYKVRYTLRENCDLCLLPAEHV
jgi:hypothetical protein